MGWMGNGLETSGWCDLREGLSGYAMCPRMDLKEST